MDLEVHDQGPGVPKDQRERIFEPFEQLAAGRAAGGAGLGLSLCRASAQALGGALGVRAARPQDSAQGAVFWVRFTAEPAPRPAGRGRSTQRSRAQASGTSILWEEAWPAN
ncbi:MAG: ATP-binding protein [Thermoflexus sp.]